MALNTFGQTIGAPGSYGSIVPSTAAPTGYAPTVPAPTTAAPKEDLLPGTASQVTGKAAPGTTPTPSPTPQQSQGTYTGQDGNQYNKYDNSPATPTSTPSSTGTTPQDQQAAIQAERDAQNQKFFDTMTGYQNGSIPLTVGENAQIDGLKQQYQTMIDQQNEINKSAVGLANVRGYQTGAAEYDPTFQARTIGAIASAGLAKVSDLMTQEGAAVAQLTKSLRDDDIKGVQDAWKMYNDNAQQRQDALQKSIDNTAKAIKDNQDELDKKNQYNLDVAKFNQTQDKDAFDNAFKIEQEKFDEKYKNQTLALEQFKAGMGAGGGGVPGSPTIVADITASGNPDPASQQKVYDQISASYGPMTAIAIKNLANYQTSPTAWSSRAAKGLTQAQAVTLAQMYDPTYDEKMYATRAAYQKSLASNQSGTVGSAVNAANKSINHLTAYVNTMTQVNKPSAMGIVATAISPGAAPYTIGRQSTIANTVMNTLTLNPTQRANISKATTEGLGVAEELAKFFKGSGTVDVASIDAWKSQISPNSSPAQVKGSTQGAIDLLTGQLEVLSEQYKGTMGKAPTTDFISPSAKASLSNLKNQGYTVDIPGVYYTDKDAYIKSDSDAQDNLTKAYQTLVQMNDPNNPPSPENVLELAQIQ